MGSKLTPIEPMLSSDRSPATGGMVLLPMFNPQGRSSSVVLDPNRVADRLGQRFLKDS